MEKEKGLFIFHHWDVMSSLSEVATFGAAHVKAALDPGFRDELLKEVAQGPFKKAREVIDVVRQNFERFVFMDRAEGMPYLETLRIATRRMIRNAKPQFPSLAAWEPKDVLAQRYDRGGYLTSHRDHSKHTGVITGYTLAGEARLEILGDTRESPPVTTYHLYPGDLFLLRGPGLIESTEELRRFHCVREVLGDEPRTCVTFRDNIKRANTIEGGDHGHDRDLEPCGAGEGRRLD